ncbi:MAG: histidine phosphatase family protein [Pseudomonadota bacterium]|uniref:histidine phosphatase family protein n=1 Tax=Roseovarius TaxID=74030 RepID=UPI0022A74001|nr:histidine phosphatase family protein [Roseovarius sp. EGI FJ00037]MCZ0810992.1 histidine phosphatase family protein [Roseovarius sp. EGI FJ00037]
MRLFLLILVLSLPLETRAQDMSTLNQPGVVALMRHALAPGTGDPQDFDLDECSTQRNLDARGRDQARRVGQALREAGVTFDALWSSQWCRARDTAKLLDLAEVTEQPALNSFFAGRGDRATQTAETLDLIGAQSPDARLLLVSHQVNISALTGSFAGSGEIIVARRRDGGGLEVIDRIKIAP